MGMDGGDGDGGSVQLFPPVHEETFVKEAAFEPSAFECVGLLFPRSLKQGLLGRFQGKVVNSVSTEDTFSFCSRGLIWLRFSTCLSPKDRCLSDMWRISS